MEFQDPMRGLSDTINMYHPLLYDQHGKAADEETSYAWACVKYARDVTSDQPYDTYVQRARKAFKDRWMVAPRRRAQDPTLSPFWPMDRYFARGHQSDLPWLDDKEFQRQNERIITLSRNFIRSAKEEMKTENRRSYRPRRGTPYYSPRTVTASSPPLYLTDFSSDESTPSVSEPETHEIERVNFPEQAYWNELPPLQIRSRYNEESPPRNLPSLRVLLHFRHGSNDDTTNRQ